jgi:hypothetical protein
MTLCAGWIRYDGGERKQLVLAADSRLTGGRTWDAAPKIVTFTRGDCAMCFAGATDDAYPLLLQAQYAVAAYPRSRTRRLDLFDLKGHLVRALNRMVEAASPYPNEDSAVMDARFLFGGWSWERQRLALWTVGYNPVSRFYARRVRPWVLPGGLYEYIFIGDYVHEARTALRDMVAAKVGDDGGFDMEPLAVIRDMSLSANFGSIGGWPQMVRIYQHMNTQPFVCVWPSQDPVRRTLFGRELLSYERTDYPQIDLDAL